MLTYLWFIQLWLIISILLILLGICFITDLPRLLGFSFSRRETIAKYIKKYMKKDKKLKKIVCNFKMIGSRNAKKNEEVYIYMYVAKYSFKKRKITTSYEAYSKARILLSRKFGIYKVIDFEMELDTQENSTTSNKEFFPEFITTAKDYFECINPKVDRFLKEANIKKAKKRFRLKSIKKSRE